MSTGYDRAQWCPQMGNRNLTISANNSHFFKALIVVVFPWKIKVFQMFHCSYYLFTSVANVTCVEAARNITSIHKWVFSSWAGFEPGLSARQKLTLTTRPTGRSLPRLNLEAHTSATLEKNTNFQMFHCSIICSLRLQTSHRKENNSGMGMMLQG
jgi:hypothetical protein